MPMASSKPAMVCPVLGEGGPITVPTDGQLIIAEDGTISSRPNGSTVGAVEVGRLKLVNRPKSSWYVAAMACFA